MCLQPRVSLGIQPKVGSRDSAGGREVGGPPIIWAATVDRVAKLGVDYTWLTLICQVTNSESGSGGDGRSVTFTRNKHSFGK